MRNIFVFFLCGVVFSGTVTAQQNAGVTVQGSVRTRAEVWNWFKPDSGDNTYAFSGNILRVSAAKSADRWDWQAEIAIPFLLGLPDHAVAPGSQGQLGAGATYFAANHQKRNTVMAFPKQLFFRWKSVGGVAGQSLRVGRFEFSDGAERAPSDPVLSATKRDHVNQRLIGPFTFTHTGRSFDGVHYSLSNAKANLTIMIATPTRGVFQTDGWGWNRLGLVYSAYTREWTTGIHAAEARVFALEYRDWRRIPKTDNRPDTVRRSDVEDIRIETFGGHLIHAVATDAAKLDIVAWGAVQSGRWGSQTHRAWAFDFEAGIQPNALPRLKPWLRAGFTEGSGDGNAADNKHETFFQVLPTLRIYARFPFFNMMNSEDAFATIAVRPHDKVTVSSEYHSLRLSNRNDLWYSGGGVYQPWSFGYTGRSTSRARSLANLYDVQAEYRINKDVSALGYFGHAQGLRIPDVLYPRGKDSQFGFIEMTYRF